MSAEKGGLMSSSKKSGGFRNLLRKSTSQEPDNSYQKGSTSHSSVDEDAPVSSNSPPKDVLSQLTEAIISCSLADVKKLVESGINISGPIDDKGQNVLHIVAFSGSLEILDYFLSLKKTDVNAVDEHNWTALLCAASVGHLRVCQKLLQNGADPKINSDQKTTPLHYLCRKLYEDVDGDPKDPKFRDKAMETYFGLLEDLIAKGVDVNAQNYLGETALMQACSRGNEWAVNFLLQNKAKTTQTNTKGESALFYAEKAGFEKIIRLVSDKKDNTKKALITHQNVKLENYADVVKLAQHPEYGLALKDRRHFFIMHNKSFLGIELVDWILRNLPIRTREEAVEYGNKLIASNWIVGVNKKKKFKDSENMYKFSSGDSTVAQVETEQKESKVSMDDFESIKVLGKGGFGKVVLVKKKDTGKVYALKVMDKAKIMNKPRDFKNLMSEKKILQNDSAFLVHLHWAFQNETDFVLVMDFVGGGDLYYHWKKNKRFPERTVQFVAAELVLAISYLHSCGIIYRDLKPQNILLGLDGHICLADFGLSKEVQSVEMGIHTACGTPTYSAPEVIEGSPYGKAIDYWSLGVVLYQFLVGKPPFEFDGDFAKLLRSIYSAKIKFPRQFMSVNASAFLDGLLQRDVAKRLDDPEIIKRHPFFKGIDWEKIEVKKVPSPIKVTSSEVTQNFDPKYTALPVEDKNDKKKPAAPEVPDFSVYFGD